MKNIKNVTILHFTCLLLLQTYIFIKKFMVKVMKKLLTFLFVILISAALNLFANGWITNTGEANNWPLYTTQWVNFKFFDEHPNPYILGTDQYSKNISCISDIEGNLQFYLRENSIMDTSGNSMMNLYHYFKKMPHLQKMIVPHPGRNNQYCVFYIISDNNYSKFKYGYFVVDMMKRDGLGDIVEHHFDSSSHCNVPTPSSTCMSAVKHKNGSDIWIVCTCYTDSSKCFYSYLLTEKGLQKPVISPFEIEKELENITDFKNINIRASFDGRRIGLSYEYLTPPYSKSKTVEFDYENRILLFNFNNENGVINKQLTITNEREVFSYSPRTVVVIQPTDFEFSPNGDFLYAFNHGKSIDDNYEIVLYSLKNYTDIDLYLSKRKVGDISNGRNMLLGPNGKIYLTAEKQVLGKPPLEYYQYFLPVINDPDCERGNSFYQQSGVEMFANEPAVYLPRFLYNVHASYIKTNIPVCEGDTLHCSCYISNAGSYLWTGPNNFTSTSSSFSIPNVTQNIAGWYKLKTDTQFQSIFDSVLVEVGTPFQISITGETHLWEGQKAVLSALPNDSKYNYYWSTGEMTPVIEVDSPRVYRVIVESKHGCKDTAEISVTVEPRKPISIDGSDFICTGDTHILNALPKGKEYKYQWSTLDTTDFITINKGGTYNLYVWNGAGYLGDATIVVSEYPKPEVSISTDKTELCEGGSAILTANTESTNSIRWSTGESSRKIEVSETGLYSVIVESAYGCRDTAEIQITVHSSDDAKVIGKRGFCKGGSTILSVDDDYTLIQWSNGATTRDITINTEGLFWFYAKNSFGCEFYSDTANVVEYALPNVTIEGKTEICPGSQVTLKVTGNFESYLWSNGETTQEISVSQAGNYRVDVIDKNGCAATAEINVKQIEIDVSEIDEFNFGEVKLNKESSLVRIFRNNGTKPVRVSSVSLTGDDAFALVAAPSSGDIFAQGEIHQLKIGFKPASVGTYSGILVIETDEPCASTIKIQVTGSAKGVSGKAFVWLPDTTAEIGDNNFCIPLYARLESEEQSINLDGAAKIKFNANSLLTDNPNAGVVLNDERTITLNLQDVTLTTSGGAIGHFCGDIVLSGKSEVPLEIESIEWSEPLDTEIKNGSLKVMFCQQNLAAVKYYGKTQFVLKPNPASDNIEINILSEETGQFSIEIFTLQGTSIEKRIWISAGKQENSINLDISKYSAGMYQIVFTTPGGDVKSMKIVKL